MRGIYEHAQATGALAFVVIACLALLLVLGGSAYAASRLPRNSVTTVQVKNHSLLARDFKAGQLPRGPAGAPGPAGPTGPAGPAGPSGSASIKWALVRPDGGIAAQSGGITLAAKPSAGTYILRIGSTVTGRPILRRRGTRVTAPAGEAKPLPVRAAVEPKGAPALRRTTPAPSSSRPGVMLARWRITRSTSRSSARRASLRPRLHEPRRFTRLESRSRLAVAS